MNPDTHVQGPEEVASRLTLIALRAMLPAAEHARPSSNAVLLHGTRYHSDLEAAAVLARRPKPVRCRASVVQEEVVVECETITDAAGLAMWRVVASDLVPPDLGYLRRRFGSGRDPVLLARDARGDLLVL